MKAHDKQLSDKPSLFPESVHCTAVIGSVGAGKTSCLLSLLLHGGWHRYYNRIIFISSTANLDPKVKKLFDTEVLLTNIPLEKIKEEEQMSLEENPPPPRKFPKYKKVDPTDVYEDYDHSIIEDIVKWQEFHVEEYGKQIADKVLVVLDDIIASEAIDLKRRNALVKTITKCRHLNTSFVLMSQYFKHLVPCVRACLTAVFFFETNMTERDHLYHTFDINLEFHVWNELVSIICAKSDHSCCQINKFNPRGFKLIWEDKEFVA